ncbi:MAG: helix-turn-helix transcriptional regulator [Ferruginibacter sp.]
MSSEQGIDAFYIHVGEKVRFQRLKARMDQETLSRHLNLSRTTIINIEKGRQRLSLEHAWLAAQILNISIEDLLPPTETKSVNEWADVVKKTDVSRKEKKGVLNWITKVKNN